jgi:hypothetical protein
VTKSEEDKEELNPAAIAAGFKGSKDGKPVAFGSLVISYQEAHARNEQLERFEFEFERPFTKGAEKFRVRACQAPSCPFWPLLPQGFRVLCSKTSQYFPGRTQFKDKPCVDYLAHLEWRNNNPATSAT